MKKVYGYTRVSTVKQGTGVSLQEQKEAIVRYAEKHDLTIIHWFEELETAAKQGRPHFSKMMKLLQTGKGDGVIIHKIDRSARNLKDWAAIGDLIDKGINVYFAHESLDMDTRGGRLTADIQAVIASDYIRNLKDETRKGIYGRLKQGLFPFGAPIGYLNNGSGQLKTIDPVQGPLIKKAFQLYASEKYSLETLTQAMNDMGLRNSQGNFISITTMSKILNHPFYAGVLKIKDKTFEGKHERLVSSGTFFKVQNILKRKTNTMIIKHCFLFRRLLKCVLCGYALIGEKQKGYIYYRCHLKSCSTKGIREEYIERNIVRSFEGIYLHQVEDQMLNELLNEKQKSWSETQNYLAESLRIQKGQLEQKLDRLTDAYIDNTIDKILFEGRKEKLLIEIQGLKHKSDQLPGQKEAIFKKATNFLELLKNVKKSYSMGILEEKREIIKSLTSNLTIQGKKLTIAMKSPFYEVANRSYFSSGVPAKGTPRNSNPEVAEEATLRPEPVDSPELRAQMKELLDFILQFFELHANEDENQ